MDFIIKHNALIGTTISAGSFFIAFIVNREKVFDFFKKYWLFILGLFALAGLWTLFESGIVTSWLRGLGKMFGVGIPLWVIIVVFVVVIAGWWFFQNINIRRIPNDDNPQSITPIQNRTLSLEDFQVRDYVEDLIDGVWWHWTYSGNTVNVPKPICPNRSCQCDLSFQEDFNRMRYGPNAYGPVQVPVTLHCPRCSFQQAFDNTKAQVLNGVMQEILSRIRTERFRGILLNRARNQQTCND